MASSWFSTQAHPTDLSLKEKAERQSAPNHPTENVNSSSRENVDPELEARVVRKLDYNVIPLLFVLCESGSRREPADE